MAKIVGLILLMGGLVPAASDPAALPSATLAKRLAAALGEQRLEAVAAQHPDEPDRFVAALFIPDAQLLVISARYASPPLMQARLAQKQYRDVYLDLQSASVPNSSVFFQDMQADGLCSDCDAATDILYEGSEKTTLFDGDWKKHGFTEKEYQQALAAADERYSRLLEILLTRLQGT